MFQTKDVEVKKNTFWFNIFFFENLGVYEIMWKHFVEWGRSQMTIWRTACLITKDTHIHSEYVIIIVFPLQQFLHERASMLRYTYIACLMSRYAAA